jgi:hypothetical protein
MPPFLTESIRQPRQSTRSGKNSAGGGIGPALAGARAVRDHNRCQAMGGARARNSAACAAVRSNSAATSSRNRPKTVGSGNDGVSAGTNAPARWISVQIGQRSSARCLRPAGLEGALRSSADGGALASALAPAETGAMRSRCTWPNETANWNASANSARYEPDLKCDRNQPIVVTLRTSHPRQNHSASSGNFSYNITSRQSGRVAIHLVCCQKSTFECLACSTSPARRQLEARLSGFLGRAPRTERNRPNQMMLLPLHCY